MSNTEAEVITAVCKNKDIVSVMQADIDDLFRSHKDVWNGLKSYYYKYRAIPEIGILEEKYRNFEPAKVGSETKFYVDKLREDYISSKLGEILLDVAEGMERDTATRSLEKIQEEVAKLSRVTRVVKDVDVTDWEAAEKYYDNLRRRTEDSGGTPGIRTGIKGIDAVYPTGMAPGHLIYMIGYTGRSKALAMDAPIATPSGWVENGSLSVGDKVIGRSGRPITVTGVFDQGEIDSYKMSFSDGTDIICSEEHLWSLLTHKTRHTTRSLKTMTTREIIESGLYYDSPGTHRRNQYKYYLPLVSPVEYSEKDYDIHPYLMGTLIANGSYTRPWNHRITTNDIEVIDYIKTVSDVNIKNATYTTSTCHQWDLGSQLRSKLQKSGLYGKRSHEKFIPSEYLFGSVEQRKEILAGLVDGDGFAGGKKNKRSEYGTVSLQLAKDFCELVRSLGGVAELHVDRKVKEKPTHNNLHTVSFWTPFNPFKLVRKARDYSPNDWFRAIVSIEKVGQREMRCISVDAKDSLYVTKDYTVTHNTWMSMYLACKAFEQGFSPMIVSLEMSPEDVRDRVYGLLGSGLFRVSDFQRGYFDTDDFRNWGEKKLSSGPRFTVISSEGTSVITPNTIMNKADQHKPDVIIVDYLQLMSDNAKTKGMTEKYTNATHELKQLAMRTNLPIIAISAVTDDENDKQDSPPRLGQVSWSKAISYDADLSISVHKHTDTDIIEMFIEKNRRGGQAAVFMKVDLDRGIIEETFEAVE